MGKAYRVSGDEKYAVEWTKQYIDWIKKNPLVKVDKKEYEKRLREDLTAERPELNVEPEEKKNV